jgi:type III restriction enzyme
MLPPKDYQDRSLEALRKYFAACHRLGKVGTAFYDTTEELWGTGLQYNDVRELAGVPYVCIRIPTGGGKTLVAAYAAGITQQRLLIADRSVILWLVPSNSILEQTYNALHNRQHDYRQALERDAGPIEVLSLAEALNVQRSVLDAQTVVIVTTLASSRVGDTEMRKVYEDSGSLMGHFDDLSDDVLARLERFPNGAPKRSLENILRVRRPIVIVDEAHNARTPLSFETLKRFCPSCILEITATPDTEKNPSNVLISVSAAELRTAEMIKLPIVLETRTDWKVLLSEAIAMRNKLEETAKMELAATGETIRPILLIQAQPRRQDRESFTVEVVKDFLLSQDCKLKEEWIRVATGDERGLAGEDLFDSKSEIRYIITVQALKEGWDCSFAYVLCSLAELGASRAVEQILGRVLRMPRAKRKTQEELNQAYAYALSPRFALAATSLQDALVENGFNRQEASEFIRQRRPDEADDLFTQQTTVTVPEIPAMERLSGPVREAVSFNTTNSTMTVQGTMSEAVLAELVEASKSEPWRRAVRNAYGESHAKAGTAAAKWPSFAPISVPVLARKAGDLFEQLEEGHLLDMPWSLADCKAALDEADYSATAPRGQRGIITVGETGKVEVHALEMLVDDVSELFASQGWTEGGLVHWLDRTIRHPDITPTDAQLFLVRLAHSLIDGRGLTLEFLVRDKYRLRQAVERLIDGHRAAAKTKAFQLVIDPTHRQELSVSPERCFIYDGNKYPSGPVCEKWREFKKHAYPRAGEMNGEEFECAKFIEELDQVECWVRNIDSRPGAGESFWLQTSTDKFYPDFVCRLTDGRILIVEYKGEDRWSNDDSKEKRRIGQLWASLSEGKCLFVMPKGMDLGKIGAIIRGQ